MVDREARRKYAVLIRQFVSGRMTNDEYEDRVDGITYDKRDHAILEVYLLIWTCYDDLKTHRLTKQWRLDRPARRQVAQAVLFLQSDAEYQWPNNLWDGWVFLVTAFCVVLLFALLPETPLFIRLGMSVPLVVAWQCYERWQARRREKAADESAWPFLRQADLDEAARQPRLLNGKLAGH